MRIQSIDERPNVTIHVCRVHYYHK